LSERRKRLHELLLALINKQDYLELIEDDSTDLTKSFSEKDSRDFSKLIERNRKILKKYHSLVRTAVTLDALMDSENEENFKINK
tara:strand:- start:1248 stop:1502 length:255 start_codon:yes stop_codon:yes gene_type:complete